MASSPPFFLRVHAVVRLVPSGQVATYGQIATLAGSARASRAVGGILRRANSADGLPWHRVINAQGRVSGGGDLVRPQLQRGMLEAEGVAFSRTGRCNLEVYRWSGPIGPLPWE